MEDGGVRDENAPEMVGWMKIRQEISATLQ